MCLIGTLAVSDFDATAIVCDEFDLEHFLEEAGWTSDREAHPYRIAYLEPRRRKTLPGRLYSFRSGQVVCDILRGDRGLRVERFSACRS